MVVGRIDDVVQVGGINVSVAAVEAAVQEHPLVAEAAVVATDDDQWGSRSLRSSWRTTWRRSAKAHWLIDRRARGEHPWVRSRPREVVVTDSLPTLPTGKIDREALRRGRPADRPPPAGMTTPAQWVAGSRPRTLPAAIVPVAVGSARGLVQRVRNWCRASCGPDCARVDRRACAASRRQLPNDYSDGIRGTDEVRVGPVRLVGRGLASPSAVKKAALLSFLVACIAGLALVLLTQAWWMLIVGVAAVAAAWF